MSFWERAILLLKMTVEAYKQRILRTLRELDVPEKYATECKLPLHPEGEDLVSIGLDVFQREQRMDRRAAEQWQALKTAAAQEGIALSVVSVFRSFDYQRGIIERKLKAGKTPEEIFCVSAIPGYSEHHTGRAIDITTPGSEPLEEEFEGTAAFAWLQRRAGEFGFTMSYPRQNPLGIIYEPWHWFWNEPR